jgi:TRAP-type mannitol/chloroaromatic compound transport system substrate-binding protein
MENEEKGVKNMKFNDEIVKKLRQTWNEVLEEETAKDPFFKKVIEDQKQYFKEVNKFINYSTLPFE